MGRGNRKKNKGGNVAICESEACTVSDNISINDGFEKVVKNVKKTIFLFPFRAIKKMVIYILIKQLKTVQGQLFQI